jgi:hypothetical protein
MEVKLTDEEWANLNKAFIAHLNTFEADSELKLGEDYFLDHIVHLDYRLWDIERWLVVEVIPDDEGGSSILFLNLNGLELEEANIEFAAWTFDTTTTVWKADARNQHHLDGGGTS